MLTICFFIESGSGGPGPTYKTMERCSELINLKIVERLPSVVFSLYQSEITFVQEHVDNWCHAHKIKLPIRVEHISATYKPPIFQYWITGFYGSHDYSLIYILRKALHNNSKIIVANSIFGFEPYILHKKENIWNKIIIPRSIKQDPETGIKSFRFHLPSAPIKRMIINNPFNWVLSTNAADIVKKLRNILLLTKNKCMVIIVCKNHGQQTKLLIEIEKNNLNPQKLIIVAGPEVNLKQIISIGDLVLSEGVGVMEDTLIKGAIGIQFIKASNAHIPSIYSNLAAAFKPKDIDRELYFIYSYHSVKNPFTNIEAIIAGFFSLQLSLMIKSLKYAELFHRYRELLQTKNSTIIENGLKLLGIKASNDVTKENREPQILDTKLK